MGLFGKLVATAINVATLPIAAAKDVVTLGGVATGMDSAKLDELERVAKAATPGPWRVYRPAVYPYLLAEDNSYIIDHNGYGSYVRRIADAHYIAAASPDTILEMVRELRVQKRALEIAVADANGASLPTLSVEHYAAQAERELSNEQ